MTNLATTHYLVGSCIGPHPFPTIVRDFQKVIGKEIKSQLYEVKGKLPDIIVACVGGGSNAIGSFYEFIPEKNVKLVGVEAGGEGLNSDILMNRRLTTEFRSRWRSTQCDAFQGNTWRTSWRADIYPTV